MQDNEHLPQIGFGTWELAEGREVEESVAAALKTGYRLIDTARIYGNETGVGKAIKNYGLPRDEVLITTKLWNSDQGYDSAFEAFAESKRKLGLDYVDLYLIHWPATKRRADAWRALVELQKRGEARSIGVSNYMVGHLRELFEQSDDIPAVNQIEFHPFIYLEQKPVLELCREKGIVVEAYSPLAQARSRAMTNDTLNQIADVHGKTVAQVMLRWAIQHGTVPIPRSSNAERIKENFDVFDFELSEEEMSDINGLSAGRSIFG